jgi:hypothetical protein
MFTRARSLRAASLAAVAALVLSACSSDDGTSAVGGASPGDCTPAETPVINFAAYSTPREVYGKIIPAFHPVEGRATRTYLPGVVRRSTTQARTSWRFEADIVALAGPDVDRSPAPFIAPTGRRRRMGGWSRAVVMLTSVRATRRASRTGTT